MINLLSNNDIYFKNKLYIDVLLFNYPFIKLILLNSDDEIINKIYGIITSENLLYSNNIILHDLNEDFIKIINDQYLNNLNKHNMKYNIYILNYENLELYDNNHFIYLQKYNINIIDYSFNNKNILDKYLSVDKHVYYLPIQIRTDYLSYIKDNVGILSLCKSEIYYNLVKHLDIDPIDTIFDSMSNSDIEFEENSELEYEFEKTIIL